MWIVRKGAKAHSGCCRKVINQRTANDQGVVCDGSTLRYYVAERIYGMTSANYYSSVN